MAWWGASFLLQFDLLFPAGFEQNDTSPKFWGNPPAVAHPEDGDNDVMEYNGPLPPGGDGQKPGELTSLHPPQGMNTNQTMGGNNQGNSRRWFWFLTQANLCIIGARSYFPKGLHSNFTSTTASVRFQMTGLSLNLICAFFSAEPFICKQCGRTFARVDKLKIHLRIHNNDKPYSCSYCEKVKIHLDKFK